MASKANLSTTAILVPDNSKYYPASQLTVRPKSTAAIVPEFPPNAAAANIIGRVVLLLLIDETGAVNDVSVAEATPAGYFEESAISAVRLIRFQPGERFG